MVCVILYTFFITNTRSDILFELSKLGAKLFFPNPIFFLISELIVIFVFKERLVAFFRKLHRFIKVLLNANLQ